MWVEIFEGLVCFWLVLVYRRVVGIEVLGVELVVSFVCVMWCIGLFRSGFWCWWVGWYYYGGIEGRGYWVSGWWLGFCFGRFFGLLCLCWCCVGWCGCWGMRLGFGWL